MRCERVGAVGPSRLGQAVAGQDYPKRSQQCVACIVVVAASILAASVALVAGQKPLPKRPAAPRSMPTDLVLRPWRGDFDGMVERRHVRVLAPYSRTFFFNEMGRERGYAADLVRVVDGYINKKLAKQLGNRPITFLLIPTTRDKLLTGVAEGVGDIAVNVGVSEERKQLVDFITAPDLPPLAEVVLTGPRSPVISTLDDLAGKTVHARPSSVYHEDLLSPSASSSRRPGSRPSPSSTYRMRSRTRT